MVMFADKLLELNLPQTRKNMLTFVASDSCDV
jgi:hypothetical protein